MQGRDSMFHRFATTRARLGLVSVIVTASALMVVGIAGATGSNITPESQWANSGAQVSWAGTWSGTAPFTVTFNYGDPDNPSGQTTLSNTSATSDTTHFHYTYYTCTAQTYTQTMTVTD